MIEWDSVKGEFAWDGALRDIYVLDATIDDWAAIWPILQDGLASEFFVNGERRDAPLEVHGVFASRASETPMLRVKAGGANLVLHFFTTEEIEGDFDPREIGSQVDLDALLSFVRRIGDSTGKRTIITPENGSEIPFIEYNPITKALIRL